jgi:hypothetical protein
MEELETLFEQQLLEYRRYREEFVIKATESFKLITAKFFEMNPGITAFTWRQYVPYFADGDPCEFTVTDPDFTNCHVDVLDDITCGEYEGEDESIWTSSAWGLKRESKDGVNLSSCEFISDVIANKDMYPVLEATFGNHITIFATRDGFDIMDYDHD